MPRRYRVILLGRSFSKGKPSLQATLIISKHEPHTTTPDTIKHDHAVRVHVAPCTNTSVAYTLKHCAQRSDFIEISFKSKPETQFLGQICSIRYLKKFPSFHNLASRGQILMLPKLLLQNLWEAELLHTPSHTYIVWWKSIPLQNELVNPKHFHLFENVGPHCSRQATFQICPLCHNITLRAQGKSVSTSYFWGRFASANRIC